MQSLGIVLICLSALGFVLAVIAAILGGPILGIPAEGFSRACSNLALIAIALFVYRKCKGEDKAGEE
jgi:hypothetical protein